MREQFAHAAIGVAAIAAVLAWSVATGGPGRSSPSVRTGRVTRVIDGDTIVVGGVGTVRYIGVDTPELHHPRRPVERFARAARRANRRLVGGATVRLYFEVERSDAHGRLLADVYVGNRFVNAELIRTGMARTLAIRPNIEMAPLLARLEAQAMRARRGIWGDGEGGVPWGRP